MFSESDKYMFSDGSKPLGKKKHYQETITNNDFQSFSNDFRKNIIVKHIDRIHDSTHTHTHSLLREQIAKFN